MRRIDNIRKFGSARPLRVWLVIQITGPWRSTCNSLLDVTQTIRARAARWFRGCRAIDIFGGFDQSLLMLYKFLILLPRFDRVIWGTVEDLPENLSLGTPLSRSSLSTATLQHAHCKTQQIATRPCRNDLI